MVKVDALKYLILSIVYIHQGEAFKDGQLLMAYRVTHYESIFSFGYNEEWVPEFIDGSTVTFRLVGMLKNVTKIALTESSSDCTAIEPKTISDIKHQSDNEGTSIVNMPLILLEKKPLYFCFNVSDQKDNGQTWIHQGSENWAKVIVVKRILSVPLIIVLIVIFVCLSGLLNGLVLGLMSLDLTELKVIANAGGTKERKYGRAILSVRKRGNFLLISLVLGATVLNSTVTVLVDLFVSEWMTVLIVTVTFVLCCEIIPNSIVSRFALVIGAKTIYLTWAVMIITSPISYPLGKLLDKVLGQDIPHLTRDRLKELVKITANVSALKKTEIDMIAGALEMSAKQVEDIMTMLNDIFSLPLETLLDYVTIHEIINSGYSRIPIYEGDKSNIIKIMYVRDLALIDPEDRTPLTLFTKLMSDQELVYVEEGTTIDVVFNILKEGHHGHMAFVVKRRSISDSQRVVVGLLTLEDIIEEIVQVEIVDEYDVIMDNRSKRKRERYRMISDYMSVFADNFESKNVLIPPNLRIAALNFMAAELPPFGPDVISPRVMQRLLRHGVLVHLPKKKPKSVNPLIFSQGQAHEGFVMILEGRAQIVIGPDNLRCETGPFSYFGLGILDDHLDDKLTYGYTVEAIGEVRYLRIPRELYQAAVEATKVERTGKGNVSLPYRGLLADEDEKELGESARNILTSHTASGPPTTAGGFFRKPDAQKDEMPKQKWKTAPEDTTPEKTTDRNSNQYRRGTPGQGSSNGRKSIPDDDAAKEKMRQRPSTSKHLKKSHSRETSRTATPENTDGSSSSLPSDGERSSFMPSTPGEAVPKGSKKDRKKKRGQSHQSTTPLNEGNKSEEHKSYTTSVSQQEESPNTAESSTPDENSTEDSKQKKEGDSESRQSNSRSPNFK